MYILPGLHWLGFPQATWLETRSFSYSYCFRTSFRHDSEKSVGGVAGIPESIQSVPAPWLADHYLRRISDNWDMEEFIVVFAK